MGNSLSPSLAPGSSSSKKIKGLTTITGTFVTNASVKFKFASCAAQGARPSMEDRLIALAGLPAVSTLPEIPDVGFFAVLDGHGGSEVVDYCKKNLLNVFQSQEEYALFVERFQSKEEIAEVLDACFRATFEELEKTLRAEYEDSCQRCGTTLVAALVTSSKVYVANVGDSRALICNLDNKTDPSIEATRDHKPSNPEEKDRIVAAGSKVVMDRIDGGISMSRAIGDFSYKSREDLGPLEQSLIMKHDFYVWDIYQKGSFLCLGCDGLWNVFSNEQVVRRITEFGARGFTMVEMTQELTGLSLKSKDNVTIAIVQLSKFGKTRLFSFLGRPAPAKRHFDDLHKEEDPLFKDEDFLS